MCNVNAYSEAIKVFRGKDPGQMAVNSRTVYDEREGRIILNYLNYRVEAAFPSGEILSATPWKLTKNEKVLILQYLTSACGVPPRENWISFIQLPDGAHHQTPFVVDALTPLAEAFSENIDVFRERAKGLGAREIKMGDYGVVIPVFPLLPLVVTLWQGDDEFPGKANILFDMTAPLHLTTAALWVMGVELSRKLRNVEGQQYSR